MKVSLIAFYIILCAGIFGCSFLLFSFMYALFLMCVFIFMYSDIFSKNKSNLTVFLLALFKLSIFLLGGYLYVENVPVSNLMGFDFRFPLLVFFPGVLYFVLGLPFLLLRRKKRVL
ncbi:hypothetical protein ABID52_001736 [Fictibacillus halophilus]|uniref:Uncharacterized protein n=1 Tax=Fictibacillus halophilus TaxID=1610490 RepID=A0ABV2LHV2_9BACL